MSTTTETVPPIVKAVRDLEERVRDLLDEKAEAEHQGHEAWMGVQHLREKLSAMTGRVELEKVKETAVDLHRRLRHPGRFDTCRDEACSTWERLIHDEERERGSG